MRMRLVEAVDAAAAQANHPKALLKIGACMLNSYARTAADERLLLMMAWQVYIVLAPYLRPATT